MAMNEKDYYEILEVSHDATAEEIRKAFQKKARVLHPDVNKEPDAEERFKEISEAYAVLSDPDKRKRYDAMRSGNPFAAARSDASSAAGGYGADPFAWGGWPFAGGYSRQTRTSSRAYNPKPGADVVMDVEIDESGVKDGVHRGVTYQHYGTCEACHGTGSVESAVSETCPTCGGTGHLHLDLEDLLGFGMMDVVCPECEGTGRVVADPCSACGGKGRVLTADEVVVDIPAGSHDGDTVRVAGKGNAGTNGQRAGDFVARVSIPKERLSYQSAQGFRLIGFTIPFIVLGSLANMMAPMLVVIALPLVIGLFFVLQQGLGGHTARWWQNAARWVRYGLTNGIAFAILIYFFMSCSAGFGTRGYMG